MIKSILFAFCFFSALETLSQVLVPVQEALEVEELRFSPDHALGGYYADFIDNITFIPFEYSKVSKIQYNPKVLILDSTIAVINNFGLVKNWEILFYSHEGQFLKKVGDFQKMCEKCKNLRSMRDPRSNDNYIYINVYIDGSQDNLLMLDLQGNFISTAYIKAQDFLTFNSSTLIYNSQRSGNLEALIANNKEGKPDTLLRYDTPLKLTDNDYLEDIASPFFANDKFIYFTAPYNSSVFRYSMDLQLEKIYNLVLPLKYSLPRDNLYQVFTEKYRLENPDNMIGIDQIISLRNNLLFDFNFAGSPNRSFIYRIVTEDWLNLNSLVPDSSSHYIPFLGKDMNIFADGEDLYTIIYPSALKLYFSEDNKKLARLGFEPVASLVEEFNPILVRFNLKK